MEGFDNISNSYKNQIQYLLRVGGNENTLYWKT